MKLSIRDNRNGDNVSYDSAAIILLVHNTKGQYGFFRGKSDLIYPLFMHGYKHWPLFIPKPNETLHETEKVFEKVQIPVEKDVSIISQELITGDYKTSNLTEFSFLLEDVDIGNYKVKIPVENTNDFLCFYDDNKKNKLFVGGWGFERQDLARFGSYLLFDKEIAEELDLVQYGGSEDLRKIHGHFREMFRDSGPNFKNGIIISPEIAEQLIREGKGGLLYQEFHKN